MAFDPILDPTIDSGDPVTADLWKKTQGNFDDHESRLGVVETSSNVFRPITFSIIGEHSVITPIDEVMVERINIASTILSARLFIVDAGTVGTTLVDVEVSTNDGGAWSSIFSTLPSVAFGEGNYSLSTNQVLSITSLSVGDLLRLNLDSAQTGSEEMHVLVEFEKS